jgi:hypothetical protein
MTYRAVASIALIFSTVVIAVPMCGGNSVSNCVPGQSSACTGNAGCSGSQVCNASGTYDPCSCGNSPDAGFDSSPPDGSPPDSGPTDSGQQDVVDAADAAPFSVLSLPGLVVWLEASMGIVYDTQQTGVLKRWQDQSGNGNDAVVSNCGSPCYVTIDPKTINGHDAVINGSGGFSPSVLRIADVASLQMGTGDWGVVMVMMPGTSQNSNTCDLWNKGGTNNGGMGIFEKGNALSMSAPGQSLNLTTTQKWQIMSARGKNLEMSAGGNSATAPAYTANVDAIGSFVDFAGEYNTEIAEVIAIKGTLSDNNLAQIQAYYKQKYKLTN